MANIAWKIVARNEGRDADLHITGPDGAETVYNVDHGVIDKMADTFARASQQLAVMRGQKSSSVRE